MSKKILYLSLFAMMVGSSAFAESITCQPQDLKISLEHETHDARYAASDPVQLTVTCKGRGSFALRSTVFAAPLLVSDLNGFSSSHFDSLLVQHTESLMKAFLATLLTAKTSSLPVTISYDPKTDKNYYDGVKVILGVTIE